MAARRKKYFRRRVLAFIVLLLVAAGLYVGVRRLVVWLKGVPAAPAVAKSEAALPFKPEKFLKVNLGDDTDAFVALSPAETSLRQMALVTGPQKSPKLVGEPVTIADFDLAVVDLPRAKGVVVLYQKLPQEGTPKEVIVGSEKVLEAAGGEPDYQAWKADRSRGLVPAKYLELAAPLNPPAPTAIVVDKWLNVLWFYDKGELVQTFPVATGSQTRGPLPTAATAMANRQTPTGTYSIETKVKGMPYYKDKIPALDPRNPLGTRWLGFSVYKGDGALVWAIHGTNDPSSMGRWVSDGCIRMTNQAVEWLYDRVDPGTVLKIVSSQPPT
jgi:lipoprotein-anchoring transpeptidase ErfK/SrfK